MSLIPKQKGGYRTIGIFPAVLRLWTKARRPFCADWEALHARDYFGAASGKQALDPVWRWAAQAEGCTEVDVQVAAALVDVTDFFESLRHDVLMEEAVAIALGLPKGFAPPGNRGLPGTAVCEARAVHCRAEVCDTRHCCRVWFRHHLGETIHSQAH